jgi:iron complex outermembrane receptor protein
MRREWELRNQKSDPEKFTGFEFRYERKHSDNLDLALSVYRNKLDAISWAGSATHVGTLRLWGIEGEISYHTEKTRLTLSHGYTKLLDFRDLPGITTSITAMPYDYGTDLTNWSNNNTKLVYQRKLDDKWTFDASMRVYWGFPGLKDYSRYHNYTQNTAYPSISNSWERTFRGSYFLDLGLNYKYSKNLEINITGYNLLGIIDKDLNKRNYVETGGTGIDFRSHAPAVGVSMTYTF